MSGGEPGIAALAGIRPGDRVLDAGGGKGRAAAAAVAAGARVVLLDRSADALAGVPADLRPLLAPVRADLRFLPFRESTFDAVLLRAVLHHLPDPLAALREAARVLRPGGAMAVVDKRAADDTPGRARRNALERIRHRGHVWSHAGREIRSLAAASRLEPEAWEEWTETRDAEEWIAGGTPDPDRSRLLRELLEADCRAGGGVSGARLEGGRLVLDDPWVAVRLRKETPRSGRTP